MEKRIAQACRLAREGRIPRRPLGDLTPWIVLDPRLHLLETLADPLASREALQEAMDSYLFIYYEQMLGKLAPDWTSELAGDADEEQVDRDLNEILRPFVQPREAYPEYVTRIKWACGVGETKYYPDLVRRYLDCKTQTEAAHYFSEFGFPDDVSEAEVRAFFEQEVFSRCDRPEKRTRAEGWLNEMVF